LRRLHAGHAEGEILRRLLALNLDRAKV